MADGVIRLEATRDLPDRALVKHVLGLRRPASAFVRPQIGVAVVRISDAGAHVETSRRDLRKEVRAFREAERRARDVAAAQRGGKRPSLAISWLLAGGPDTNDVHADQSTIPADSPATLAESRPWTLADCLDYGRTCHHLLREALPSGRWIGALHLDEKAVHYQAEMVGIVVDETGKTRVGNAVIRESLARLAPDFAAENARIYEKLRRREAAAEKREAAARAAGGTPKKRRRWIDRGPDHPYLTAEAQMRLIHDLYAVRFARFGIVRGKGGRKQHHERVDRGKAMVAKLTAVQRATEATAEREREAVERAQVEEARANALRPQAEALDNQIAAAAKSERQTLDRVKDAEGRLSELRDSTATVVATRTDEEALAARWPLGKRAARARTIRDEYERRILKAEQHAAQELELRRAAEEALATRTKAHNEARKALTTAEERLATRAKERDDARRTVGALRSRLAKARAWAKRWRDWATQARRAHPVAVRDAENAGASRGYKHGVGRGVRCTVSYLLEEAREHLPGGLPGRLVALLKRCHAVGTHQPLLEAWKARRRAETPPEREVVSPAARERAPAQHSRRGRGRGVG